MNALLLPLTLLVVVVLVLVLVVYLVGIVYALMKARASLERLSVHLERTRDQTSALSGHLGAINGALPQLRDGLLSTRQQFETISSLARGGRDRGSSRDASGSV